MPTYEYKCDACGHTFEKFQSMSADPIKKCPVCGKNKVQRLIGAGAGLIFKGSGFYITDYREQGYTDKAKADKPPESKESSSTSGDTAAPAAKPDAPAKTESKPAAETKPASKAEPAKSASPPKKSKK